MWADPDLNGPVRALAIVANTVGPRVTLPSLGMWATLVVGDSIDLRSNASH